MARPIAQTQSLLLHELHVCQVCVRPNKRDRSRRQHSLVAICPVASTCRAFQAASRGGRLKCGASSLVGPSGQHWDVLGLGQAMVDFSASVPDDRLDQLGVPKGGRRVIDVDGRAHALELLKEDSYEMSAGGSLSNTLVALSRLSAAHQRRDGQLNVAAASVSGGDVLGEYYRNQLVRAGVAMLAEPLPGSSTGTVVVLTTPDANRTFLSYLGSLQHVRCTPAVQAAIRASRLMIIEGYLWELPGALPAITHAVETAHASGTLVAMTAGDASLMARHCDKFWGMLDLGVDILFANRREAAALLGAEHEGCGAKEAALALGPHCDLVAVTDGANGSCLCAMGELQVIPPYWTSAPPVDTCGAGDAYAAGLLFGWLRGSDLATIGRSAAKVASAVIGQRGSALTERDATDLVGAFPSGGYRLRAQSLNP